MASEIRRSPSRRGGLVALVPVLGEARWWPASIRSSAASPLPTAAVVSCTATPTGSRRTALPPLGRLLLRRATRALGDTSSLRMHLIYPFGSHPRSPTRSGPGPSTTKKLL